MPRTGMIANEYDLGPEAPTPAVLWQSPKNRIASYNSLHNFEDSKALYRVNHSLRMSQVDMERTFSDRRDILGIE